MQKKEMFEHIDQQGLATYLVLEKTNELMSGIYIGVETNMVDKHIYYRSILEDLKINTNSISFTLKKFEYSDIPISPHSTNIISLDKNNSIPLILKLKIYFEGTIDKNKISLNRLSDMYDSRSDSVILIKNIVTNN